MSEYTMGGAVLGAFLVAILGAVYLLSQGWYYDNTTTGGFWTFMQNLPLFLWMFSIVIGLLVGALIGALIGNYRQCDKE
jgi:hypothetical protein